MASIQKNVASQNITFCLVNATTGAAVTGATPTVYVTKDGTQAASAGTVTELKVSSTGHGAYNYAPTQAETNCTDFGILVINSGSIPVNLDFHTDIVDGNGYQSVNLVDIAGSAVSTSTAQLGVNVVNIAGTASAGTAGYVAPDWGHVNAPTTTVNLSGTTISTSQAVASVSGAVGSVTGAVGSVTGNIGGISGVTIPSTIASPTNITAGTITTVTNLTNAPTTGDFTATMKTSIGTAVAGSAVASVTGNVGGNVTGSVGSVVGLTASNLDATVSSRLATSGYTTPPTASAIASAVTTTAMTESYAAQGATLTPAQALYQLVQQAGQMSISGTTETVLKRDGATTAKTFTLNSATAPTAIVETT